MPLGSGHSWITPSRRGLSCCYSSSALGFSPQPCTATVRRSSEAFFAPPIISNLSNFTGSFADVRAPSPEPLGFSCLVSQIRVTRVLAAMQLTAIASADPACVRNNCIGRSGAMTSLRSALAFPFAFDCGPRTYTLFCLDLHTPQPTQGLPQFRCQPAFFSSEIFVQAGRHIGGSGVSTQLELHTGGMQLCPLCRFDSMSLLSSFASFWIPFWWTLLIWVFLTLFGLLVQPFLSVPFRSRRLKGISFLGALPTLALPLQVATPAKPVMSWQPTFSRARRGKPTDARARPRSGVLQHLLVLLAHCLLGRHNMPHYVGPTHTCLVASVWLLTPDVAFAMARTETPDDPDGPPPWDLHPDPLPHLVGMGPPVLPWADRDRASRAASAFRIGTLPWHPDPPSAPEEDQWLGVYVYTPHFQPIELAVKASRQQGSRPILDAIVDSAPGVPDKLFQCAVPVIPQRSPGYLHVIRFPSILGGLNEPCAAVMLDLTAVGGRYFATVLPAKLAYESLLTFLKPFASPVEGDMYLYIGARTRPWPSVAEVVLRHGDAITVFRAPQAPCPGAPWTNSFSLKESTP